MSERLRAGEGPGLGEHLRVLAAVIKKEWVVFLRYPMNAVMSVVQPLMWLVPVYFMGLSFSSGGVAAGFRSATGTANFLAYLLLGGLAVSYLQSVLWGVGWSLKNEMDQGTLEGLWLTPNSRVLLLVGRSAVSILLTTLETVGIVLAARLVFGPEVLALVGPALLLLVPMVVALYGFGIAFAGLVLMMREANFLTDAGGFVVQLLSGAATPLQSLPKALFVLGLALPVTYTLDALRVFILGTDPVIAVPISLAVTLASAVAFPILGSAVFRRIEARVRAWGTLAMH